MAIALAKERKSFVERMVSTGRFHDPGEVVEEALRRMEAAESDYLCPPPLTAAQVERIYGPDPEEDRKEVIAAKRTKAWRRRAAKRGLCPEDL
ncbi:MAG: hypothetical protein HYY24_17910 [Verrucomicrobia bacterium]|nr:hypothetical protein [Verrucomicrobiota bacterium]